VISPPENSVVTLRRFREENSISVVVQFVTGQTSCDSFVGN